MYCKKCGAALPSHGFICKSCGAMMDSEQIKEQKEYLKENKNNNEVILKSDLYGVKHNYEKNKDNKVLGAFLIILVLLILIIIAILKVM